MNHIPLRTHNPKYASHASADQANLARGAQPNPQRLQRMREVIEKVNPDPAARSTEETSEFNLATAGLGVALHLLHALSSSKPLLESGQTTILATRDKPKTDPSYFEPHDFLVKLRAYFRCCDHFGAPHGLLSSARYSKACCARISGNHGRRGQRSHLRLQ